MDSLKSFRKVLGHYSSLYLDTTVFIYHLGNIETYVSLTLLLFELIEAGAVKAHTSVLSLLELNVKPYQLLRKDLALAHIALLKNVPHLEIHEISLEMADRAAALRAQYNLRTPDALHIASALSCHCDAVVGNDQGWAKVREISFLSLDRFRKK